MEYRLVKNRSSQLNFFELGAKFVERSMDEMFDVVTDLFSASVPHLKHPAVKHIQPPFRHSAFQRSTLQKPEFARPVHNNLSA
jgi:hypothetical protein